MIFHKGLAHIDISRVVIYFFSLLNYDRPVLHRHIAKQSNKYSGVQRRTPLTKTDVKDVIVKDVTVKDVKPSSQSHHHTQKQGECHIRQTCPLIKTPSSGPGSS